MARRPLPEGHEPEPLPQHLWGLIRSSVPPIHPEGRRFVAAPIVVALLGWRHGWLRRASLLSAGALALFFRHPNRVPPSRPGAVVAPADGEVTLVDEAVPPPELGLGEAPLPRVSIFLSVLDVHVQRAPIAGRVAQVEHTPGQFLPADVAQASTENERCCVRLETEAGTRVGVVQTAGLVARRILCEVVTGDQLKLAETYGLIRFGSRVDTYLPAGTTLLPEVGQRAVGGETLLAVLD